MNLPFAVSLSACAISLAGPVVASACGAGRSRSWIVAAVAFFAAGMIVPQVDEQLGIVPFPWDEAPPSYDLLKLAVATAIGCCFLACLGSCVAALAARGKGRERSRAIRGFSASA